MTSGFHIAIVRIMHIALLMWAGACSNEQQLELVVEKDFRFCAFDARDQIEPNGQLKRNKAELFLAPGRYNISPETQIVPFEFRGLNGNFAVSTASKTSVELPTAHYPFLYLKTTYETDSGVVDIEIGTSYSERSSKAYRIGEIDQVSVPGLLNLSAWFYGGPFPELPLIRPEGHFGGEFGSCEMAFRPDDLFEFEFKNGDILKLIVRSQFVQVGAPEMHGRLVSAIGSILGRPIAEQRYEYLAYNFNAKTSVPPPPGLSILWDEQDGTCGLNLVYTIFGPIQTHGYSAYLLDCNYFHLEPLELIKVEFDQSKYIDLHEEVHPPEAHVE